VVALVRACHPGPTIAVTTIAVLLGVSVSSERSLLLVVGVTVLVGQLSIGWSNDWLDVARDTSAGRTDKPAASGQLSIGALRSAALGAGVLSVPLSLIPGWSGAWHLVLVGSGWAYNLGLKGTVWSPLPYVVGFGALPVYVVRVSGSSVPWWMVVAGALLGTAVHFANAAPDVEQDRAAGVWGLPQRIGESRSVLVALAALGAAGIILLGQLSASGVVWVVAVLGVLVPLTAGSVLVAMNRTGRSLFLLVMMAAVVDVALLVVAA